MVRGVESVEFVELAEYPIFVMFSEAVISVVVFSICAKSSISLSLLYFFVLIFAFSTLSKPFDESKECNSDGSELK